jgi:hypothetical protein
MRIAAFLAVLALQAAPRLDPGQQLAEANRLRDLALHDRAEAILRAFIKAAPGDSQLTRWILEYRAVLCEVLLSSRQLDDLKIEAEVLRRNPDFRIQGLSFLAAAAWHSGAVAEAQEFCAEADRIVDKGAGDEEFRRRLRMIGGLKGWKRFESATHVFHYPPESSIAADPVALGKRLDLAFDRVRADLDVTFPGKIEAYFFDNQAQADDIVERSLPTAVASQRTYYARADAPPGYAIAQVVSFYAANRHERRPPRLPGFCEGFYAAHAEDALWDLRRKEIPARLAAEDRLPKLVEIFAEPHADAEAYAVSGSFVRWLIRSRGRDNFRRFWGEYNILEGAGEKPDLLRPWVAVYGAPPSELEAAWRSSIK